VREAGRRRHPGGGLSPPDAPRWVGRLGAGALLLLLVSGCVLWRPTVTPLRQQTLHRAAGNRCLMVLLPGRFDRPASFARAGFGEAVRARGLALDVVAVDAHLGYYRERTVLDRLRADVVAPARAAGYQSVWIGGVSLGGLGSLLYLRDHPQDLAGVVALAPYLGEDALIAEIEAAGGPLGWPAAGAPTGAPAGAPAGGDAGAAPGARGGAPAEIRPDGDVGRELWRWLAPWLAGPRPVPLYLGWGEADALARANRLAASVLPPAQVLALPGGHDWPTWRALWDAFLDRAAPCGEARLP
jgi:pimeloyl-ACP methyl ester carboxylesterase